MARGCTGGGVGGGREEILAPDLVWAVRGKDGWLSGEESGGGGTSRNLEE